MIKDVRSAKSISIKYAASLKSVPSAVPALECIEDQVDFGDVILAAANKFECPISIDVCRNSLPGHINKNLKKPERKSKLGKNRTPMVSIIRSEDTASTLNETDRKSENEIEPSDTLIIATTHNSKNRIVEILISRYRYHHIPRVLMQVLGIILPSYTKLIKFTINDCLIDKYTIPELSNILSVTKITDVCLDSSFLPEGNYDVLLQKASSLQNISLKRCKINDEVCQRIVSKLHFLQPIETTLVVLNLSSNRITDVGAKLIGEALRSNRHLRYLNLADNGISDEGARYILDALKEFPLNNNEIMNKRQQYIKYLRNLLAVYHECLEAFKNISIDDIKSSRRKTSSVTLSRKSKDSEGRARRSLAMGQGFANAKAELMALELVGPFDHPFLNSHIKDGFYAKGNMILCYLNLAYNHLMFPSLSKLLDVLEYQKIHRNKDVCGLIKVVLDGNNLPKFCTELKKIDSIFKQTTRK